MATSLTSKTVAHHVRDPASRTRRAAVLSLAHLLNPFHGSLGEKSAKPILIR